MSETVTIKLALRDSRGGQEGEEVTGRLAGEHFVVHQDRRGLKMQPWRITHRHTGLRLPGDFWTEGHAGEYAQAVAAIPGADWSADADANATAKTHLRRIVELRTEIEEADRKAWCSSPLPVWPHDEPPTADTIARYYAVTAQAAYNRSTEVFAASTLDRSDPAYRAQMIAELNASRLFVGEWAALRLMRALIEHAPEAADEVAADLWGALESGDALGEWLWQWLVVDYRIDPDAVAERQREHEEKRKQRQAGDPS